MSRLARAAFFALGLLALPAGASTVMVRYEATCNDDAPFVSGANGSCALFGLGPDDTVQGAFSYDASRYAPGSITTLADGEYEFLFTFGDQVFTADDNALNLSFLVSANGVTISSIAAIFVNANGAELSLLTPGTVLLEFGADGADTFGEGGAWAVTPPEVIPLPAAVWLFVGALGALGLARRRPASR